MAIQVNLDWLWLVIVLVRSHFAYFTYESLTFFEGAHFEIPPSYLNASEINNETYSDLLSVLGIAAYFDEIIDGNILHTFHLL